MYIVTSIKRHVISLLLHAVSDIIDPMLGQDHSQQQAQVPSQLCHCLKAFAVQSAVCCASCDHHACIAKLHHANHI